MIDDFLRDSCVRRLCLIDDCALRDAVSEVSFLHYYPGVRCDAGLRRHVNAPERSWIDPKFAIYSSTESP